MQLYLCTVKPDLEKRTLLRVWDLLWLSTTVSLTTCKQILMQD